MGLVNKSNKDVVRRGGAQIEQTLAILFLFRTAGNNAVSKKQEGARGFVNKNQCSGKKGQNKSFPWAWLSLFWPVVNKVGRGM